MVDRSPNILLIITDQQARQAMGAYGNSSLRTPNMDAIASNGVRFERSYCASPVCGPSRNSLYTGRMPHETGALVNGLHPKPNLPTIGSIFAEAGYAAAWAGGWGMPVTDSAVEYLSRDLWGNMRYGSQSDSTVADNAVSFLEREHDRPFMLSVCLTNPHDICWSVREDPVAHPNVNSYPQLPENFAVDPEEPGLIQWCRERPYYGEELQYTRQWSEPDWRSYLNTYYRLVEEVDQQVGRIVESLRRQGLEQETLIVFTSDHGEGMAAHKWIVKLSLYENPVSVPLIVSWKGMTPPGVSDENHLVSGIDILPTICDYASIPCPDEVTGTSLRPYIEKPTLSGREYVTAELYPDTKDLGKMAIMIRSQRHKFIRCSEGTNPEQLFDMRDDPGEIRNLAGQAHMKTILKRHRRWADDYLGH
ncbi:MAG: sulfatase-like hydrolase/transferase [Candidatus Latescibacteria bacterium]|nr:sulfatase-like hydrolase/transferase [Candidatus Latescibacterota bacterium]